MSRDCGAVELMLARTRFVQAVLHWGLDPAETAALLGLPPPASDTDPLAVDLGVDAETRLRLVTEVAHCLDRLFSVEQLLVWLRDDEDEAVTPLEFMSGGQTELRAMRAAAAARSA